MQGDADRPNVGDVGALLDALEAAVQGAAAPIRDPLVTPSAPLTAREALDRLAAICVGCAERLRAHRDAAPDSASAARTTRLAWMWHITGLRLREVGPRRARAAVLRQLERRAAEDAVIAPACTRAAALIEAVLKGLEVEAARRPSPPTKSAATGRSRSPRVSESTRAKHRRRAAQTGSCDFVEDAWRAYAAPTTSATSGELPTSTVPSPPRSVDP